MIDARIQLCNIKSSGLLIRTILEVIVKSLNFEIECPLKKSSKLKVNAINLKQLAFAARTVEPNGKRKAVLLFTTGSRPVPIFSLNIYVMRVDVD